MDITSAGGGTTFSTRGLVIVITAFTIVLIAYDRSYYDRRRYGCEPQRLGLIRATDLRSDDWTGQRQLRPGSTIIESREDPAPVFVRKHLEPAVKG